MIAVDPSEWIKKTGRLTGVSGRIRASVEAGMGEIVHVQNDVLELVPTEVIGFDSSQVQLMPLQNVGGFRQDSLVVADGTKMRILVGNQLLGRVVNALGQPIDGQGPVGCHESVDVQMTAPEPLSRMPIAKPFVTGQKAIDSLLTLGQGQRVGLFAGSGVGKSTLLGDIAKYAESDINVVALIGERGREVRPFVEECLGPVGLAKSVVIVSTSDEPPLARIRAAESAIAAANWFRGQGNNVLLMLDSITRFAHASRELGLSLGEPPSSRGYTPSVFQRMAQLLEQLGNNATGSITALVTVLVDGDDMNEPISDAARSILDGHIVLDRKLAHKGHFPAIDVLASASRLYNEVTSVEQQKAAAILKRLMATYNEVEDLIQIGAHKRGVVPATDLAIDAYPQICGFLTQAIDEPKRYGETMQLLGQLVTSLSGAQA